MVTLVDAKHQPTQASSSVSVSPTLRSPYTGQVQVGENYQQHPNCLHQQTGWSLFHRTVEDGREPVVLSIGAPVSCL